MSSDLGLELLDELRLALLPVLVALKFALVAAVLLLQFAPQFDVLLDEASVSGVIGADDSALALQDGFQLQVYRLYGAEELSGLMDGVGWRAKLDSQLLHDPQTWIEI